MVLFIVEAVQFISYELFVRAVMYQNGVSLICG